MRLQDLPRHLAKRCLDIPHFCASLGLSLHGTRLIVAYSTGLDSTALLHLLTLLRPRHDLHIIAAHAHHGLRPEADAELTFAQAVCADLGIVCESAPLNIPEACAQSGLGVEECARELRYAFLETVRIQHAADWIVTAHHADDLAEDIFLRLIRGTGWPGLGGMTALDGQRRLLRPILDWEKAELRAFLEQTKTPWLEDASNTSHAQTRNRIRHTILPLVRQENPSFARTALDLWRLARLDDAYWREQIPSLPHGLKEYFLEAKVLNGAQAQRLRMYKAVLDALGPGQVRARQLFALDAAWMQHADDQTFQFPGAKIVRVEKTGLWFGGQNREKTPVP